MFGINFSSLLICFGTAALTVALVLHLKIRRLTGSQYYHLHPLRAAYSIIGFAAMLFGLMMRFDSLCSASPAEEFWNVMKIVLGVICLFSTAHGITEGFETNELGARYYFLLAFVSASIFACITASFF